MDRMPYLEPARRDEILAEAVEHGTAVVVAVRRGNDWVTHKSHFVAHPEAQGALLIAGPLTTESGANTPLAPGEPLGVSFRHGHKKCMFGTVVEEVHKDPHVLVVRRPEELRELQRRVYQRSSPPRGTTIEVRYWAAGPAPQGAAAPPPPNAYRGTLKDLSVGGIRIDTRAQPPFRIGQTVVCHFTYKRGAPPLTLEGSLRHRQIEARGSESLGVQFVGLEASPAGRKRLVRLAKIVSEFQRSGYGAAHSAAHKPKEVECLLGDA